MFDDLISSTPFTSMGVADIGSGLRYNSAVDSLADKSLKSTLEALFVRRQDLIKDGYTIWYDVKLDSKKKVVCDTGMYIGWYEDVDKAVEGFVKNNPDYIEVKKVEAFFKTSYPVRCLIKEETKTSILFLPAPYSRKKLHYAQISIPLALPWFFGGDAGIPLNDSETELVLSLADKSSERYINSLHKIFDEAGMYDKWIQSSLSKFLLGGQKTAKEKLASQRDRACREIKEYEDAIKNRLSSIRSFDERIMGIDQSIADIEGSETNKQNADFFRSAKDNVELLEVNEDFVDIMCKGYLDVFDPDAASRVIKNKTSCIYGDSHFPPTQKADVNRLLTEVFLTAKPKIKIQVRAQYSITQQGVNTYRVGDSRISSYGVYNAHIGRYGCMGGYTQEIDRSIKEGVNLIELVSICNMSTRNINWMDTTVAPGFIRDIWSTKCCELPDGQVLTGEDAAKWLNTNDTAKEK